MIVGIVGDTHIPFVHPNYLVFCQDTFDRYGVDKVVMIGDVVDHHAMSFWDHDPDGESAEREALMASEVLREWHENFPGAKVCIGNHDERAFRSAKKAGIPGRYLKSYKDVFGTKTWKWEFSHVIDGVLYEHGTGSSGKDAAFLRAMNKRQSVCMGHTHTHAGVKYHTNHTSRIFGLNVGCGIDTKAYAFEYGRDFVTKPTLGCGIVVDGIQAYFEPMLIGKGEHYQRGK
jgi:predicted phosphodiesterase